jgi:hypothetical protein
LSLLFSVERVTKTVGDWSEFLSLWQPAGRPVIVGFTAGSFARSVENLSDANITKAGLNALASIYGAKVIDSKLSDFVGAPEVYVTK